MSFEYLRLEREGAWARIVLDRPPLNVLTTPMMAELAGALGDIAGDPTVTVLELTGEGRAFCAGVDVADHTDDKVGPMLETFHDVVRRLLDLEIPVVAAVNGAALGGGCELLLACDVVLARAGAKLGQPEIRLGVFPPAAAALLPRIAGRQTAMDLILSGRTVRAEEAVGMGLVARTVPADDFREVVDEYMAELSALSGPVLRLAKKAVMGGLEKSRDAALEHAEALYLGELMDIEDAHEGLRAFMEKRTPVWKGM